MNYVPDYIHALITAFFGSADGLLYALIILVILDYITGVCVAIHSRRLSSGIGAKGIAKKVMIFVLVSLSHIVDECLIPPGDVLRVVTTTFYLVNEGISIMENAKRMGIPLPSKLIDIIENLHKKTK